MYRVSSICGARSFPWWICGCGSGENSSPIMERGLAVGLHRDAGIVRPDGRMVYLSATCSPSVDNHGTVGGCSVILRDITRIHCLELQLEAERRSLRGVFAAASVGLCLLDDQAAIEDFNEAASGILAIRIDEARGMQFGDAFQCANSLEAGCGHGSQFPLEVNRASYEELLRVPGIGPVSARRVLSARRTGLLSFDNLKKLGVVLKRAQYFITCGGKMAEGLRFTPETMVPQLEAMVSGRVVAIIR